MSNLLTAKIFDTRKITNTTARLDKLAELIVCFSSFKLIFVETYQRHKPLIIIFKNSFNSLTVFDELLAVTSGMVSVSFTIACK